MHWLDFVAKYREDNPHMSYKEALKACSAPFKTHKKKQKYEEPKLKRQKKKKGGEEDCGCYIMITHHVGKSLRDKIKKECGFTDRKKGKPKPLGKPRIRGSGSSSAPKGKRAKPTSKKK